MIQWRFEMVEKIKSLKADKITVYHVSDIFDRFEAAFPHIEEMKTSNLFDLMQEKADFSYGDSEGVLIKWHYLDHIFDDIKYEWTDEENEKFNSLIPKDHATALILV
jgi:hypothetical protein